MSKLKKSDWLMPLGLIFLSLVPVVAGGIRLASVMGDVEINSDNARFMNDPIPVVLHILSATIFCVSGALQFSTGLRNRNLKWHRYSGRIVLPCGIISALTGLWMTQFYPLPTDDGGLLYGVRWLVGLGMLFSLIYGFMAILHRDIKRHKAWIMRGYALGIGAGTQVLVVLPWVLIIGDETPLQHSMLMSSAWLINLLFVEWILHRKPKRKTKTNENKIIEDRFMPVLRFKIRK